MAEEYSSLAEERQQRSILMHGPSPLAYSLGVFLTAEERSSGIFLYSPGTFLACWAIIYKEELGSRWGSGSL